VKQNRVDYCSRTPNESEQQIQQTNEQRKKEHKIKIQFRIYYLFVALQENNNDIGFVSCCNNLDFHSNKGTIYAGMTDY
jgi:hypothetical protein